MLTFSFTTTPTLPLLVEVPMNPDAGYSLQSSISLYRLLTVLLLVSALALEGLGSNQAVPDADEIAASLDPDFLTYLIGVGHK